MKPLRKARGEYYANGRPQPPYNFNNKKTTSQTKRALIFSQEIRTIPIRRCDKRGASRNRLFRAGAAAHAYYLYIYIK